MPPWFGITDSNPPIFARAPEPMPMPTPFHQHCQIDSALGPLRLARTPLGLCGVWFEGQRHAPAEERFAPEHTAPDDPLLAHTAAQLQAYLQGRLQAFDVPLDLSAGTAFQQRVWHALLQLPHGGIGHYGQLAGTVGQATAARAVGAAVGRNPVSIIVPCHRVLGRDGQLTGYAGGLWRKRALLQLEGHPLS